VKAIVLAGGSGTRLYPITQAISKQLLPVYDKPMIFYPLSVLMLAGIKEILIITTPQEVDRFKQLLGTGSDWGISLEYKVQDKPRGIADAFIVAEDFIGDENVCLILGDNIFYGQGFTEVLRRAVQLEKGALIFGYPVKNPESFGVAELDDKFKVLSLEEKPIHPKSNYAVTGLYMYDNSVVKVAKAVLPSVRGEVEITDVNREYLKEGSLRMELLGRGFAWLDTGTHENLLEAGMFVQAIEKRQGYKIACLAEIAYLNGWIDDEKMRLIAKKFKKTNYGTYIEQIIRNSWNG